MNHEEKVFCRDCRYFRVEGDLGWTYKESCLASIKEGQIITEVFYWGEKREQIEVSPSEKNKYNDCSDFKRATIFTRIRQAFSG